MRMTLGWGTMKENPLLVIDTEEGELILTHKMLVKMKRDVLKQPSKFTDAELVSAKELIAMAEETLS